MRRGNSSGESPQVPLYVGEIDERGIGDGLLGAQLGELSFRKDDVRLDCGTGIRITVAHVGPPEAFRPQLEQTPELAGPAQTAGRVGPRVLEPDPPFLEARMTQ